MPPRKWIDKKTATTYQLFHRSQNDPLIHDPTADDRVLYQVSGPAPSSASTSSKGAPRKLTDLEKEFDSETIRKNEGEAANYGIFYDDTEYDYMQHLRELGTGGGDSHFVEANPTKGKGKAGAKGMKLEDALREVSLNDARSEFGGSRVGSGYGYGSDMRSTASSYVRKPTYQDQQDVPDDIAGFKPDMDPRLREVLEALDDEAYVEDDDDEDVFGKLTSSAEEVEPGEWEDGLFDNENEDDEGWESDATEKAPVYQKDTTTTRDNNNKTSSQETSRQPGELPGEHEPVPDLNPEDQGWMREFAKFKKDIKSNAAAPPAAAAPSVTQRTTASTMFTAGGTPIRRKKRKGALTNPSAYSMTSSALARTEGHRLLDDRFDRVEALYALDEEGEEEFDDASFAEGMSTVSGMTGFSLASSQAPSLVSAGGGPVSLRSDFNQVMDDFLDGWDGKTSAQAKRKGAKAKRGKNGNEVIGMRMLDEIRQGLGPAKLPSGRIPGKA